MMKNRHVLFAALLLGLLYVPDHVRPPLIGHRSCGIAHLPAPPLTGQRAGNEVGAQRSRAVLASLPAEVQASISAALGSDLPTYRAQSRGGSTGRFRAENARHELAADFTAAGIELRHGSEVWRMAFRGYGYGDGLGAVTAAIPRARSNRVEYRRGALTEWYVNGPLGLEQGFTLNKPPRSKGAACGTRASLQEAKRAGQAPHLPAQTVSEPLTIALALSGHLTATVDDNRTAMTLTDRQGHSELRYAGLRAHDADDKKLPAWLEVQGEQLLLRVDDARASYPVVVDPWVQMAKLTASDGSDGDQLGWSLALDGNTVVVGAPQATTVGLNQHQGAVYVFVKQANGWANMTEIAKLTASDVGANDGLGTSVAISGDTVVAGASDATLAGNSAQGAAYVYVKPASGWANMTESAKLSASDGAAGDKLGISVSISGNTLVAGAYGATISQQQQQGAAYVFVKPTSGWANMTQTAKVTASDGASSDGLGYSVSISGNTIAAGAPYAKVGSNSREGAAYVFVEPAGGWADMTETAKLTVSHGAPSDWVGFSVSINGDMVVAGAPLTTLGPNIYQGEVFVFVKPGGGWANTTEAAKLTASDGAAYDLFGRCVSISGGTIVAGAPDATVDSNPVQGAAYVFIEPPRGWTTTSRFNSKLTASDGAADEDFGSSASVSGDTVLAGAPDATVGANQDQGAAYVFEALGITVSSPGLSFPPQVLSTTSTPQTVTLTNHGTDGLTVKNISVGSDFSQTNTCGSSLEGGTNCSITVTFAPTATGPRKSSINVIDDSGGTLQAVILTGVGVAASVVPTSLNFASQAVGTSSSPKMITLTNKGGATMHLWQIVIAGTNKGDFSKTSTCGPTLAGGASCTVSVTFKPAVSGSRTASVLFSTDGGGSPQHVSLTGNGTAGSRPDPRLPK